MQGQWMGRNEGNNDAFIILDLDKQDNNFVGHFYFYDDDYLMPGMVGRLELSPPYLPHEGILKVRPLHPQTGYPVSKQDLQSEYPDITFPNEIYIKLNSNARHEIIVDWYSQNNVEKNSGQIKLIHFPKNTSSILVPNPTITDWDSFKHTVLQYEPETFIFRGQSNHKWPLQTSFHRSNRTDLIPFIEKDIPRLFQRLSAHLKFQYDLRNAEQYAAFLNLLQHHGYPTPLLDWTYSPFVAAYFAYRNLTKANFTDDFVRIFLFDIKLWKKEFMQLDRITYTRPHFSIFQPLSYDNHRAGPQQSVLSATNIVNIEQYIQVCEQDTHKTFLQAIDLPSSEYKKALRELSMMGISEATLFPSIDGICEEMRQKLF
ncbi:FRG domain-containing protein [Hirschia maritima]|uniref:FRG domain-containing protein n=1 Tax=Hirschia maritima TaxID=1121961 RepID=UPI00035E17B0|nr:FRG domain-containing protein [Hirschia maritima]